MYRNAAWVEVTGTRPDVDSSETPRVLPRVLDVAQAQNFRLRIAAHARKSAPRARQPRPRTGPRARASQTARRERPPTRSRRPALVVGDTPPRRVGELRRPRPPSASSMKRHQRQYTHHENARSGARGARHDEAEQVDEQVERRRARGHAVHDRREDEHGRAHDARRSARSPRRAPCSGSRRARPRRACGRRPRRPPPRRRPRGTSSRAARSRAA